PFSSANRVQRAFRKFLYLRLSSLSSGKLPRGAITLSKDSGVLSVSVFQLFSFSAFSLATSLHLEGHFRINAVACDFFPIHACAEFLYINGANIAQCLGGFRNHILRCFFPTFRRFRKYLDHFYDFWHELDFLSLPFRAAS